MGSALCTAARRVLERNCIRCCGFRVAIALFSSCLRRSQFCVFNGQRLRCLLSRARSVCGMAADASEARRLCWRQAKLFRIPLLGLALVSAWILCHDLLWLRPQAPCRAGASCWTQMHDGAEDVSPLFSGMLRVTPLLAPAMYCRMPRVVLPEQQQQEMQ